jgi:3',5'-cyclic-AMP phosphodiesterase
MEKLYRIVGSLSIIIGLLWACNDPFSFSPFESQVSEPLRNTTEKNLARILTLDTVWNKPFNVALISDSHYHFDDLADAIADINQTGGFSFIIVTGDITENGLLKEFEIFHQIMSRSTIPWLTVIGNHDYLSNGSSVYREMFGPMNYAFVFHNVKFVMWDNTIWESNQEADYNWLSEALASPDDMDNASVPYNHVITLSHIPPFDGQLKGNAEKFNRLLRDNNVKLSVHGHKHQFFAGELFEGGLQYMTVGSPQYRSYASLTITPAEITIRKIDY